MIAIIYFPGMNCEEETKRAVESTGLQAKIIRWNESVSLDEFAGFVLPGGWSYEDRIRAGVIASKQEIITQLRKQAKRGKPIIGICNGCQILVEAGLVPELGFDEQEIALAPNNNPRISGYYCTWVSVKAVNDCAFLKKGEILSLPIAHAQGRFVTSSKEVLHAIDKRTVLRYCNERGEVIDWFPWNPNGSQKTIAGLSNKQGNVLALMPHPERANWLRQVPGHNKAKPDEPGPGRIIFKRMKEYVEKNEN